MTPKVRDIKGTRNLMTLTDMHKIPAHTTIGREYNTALRSAMLFKIKCKPATAPKYTIILSDTRCVSLKIPTLVTAVTHKNKNSLNQ